MTSQRGPGRSQSSGNSGGGSTVVHACPKCKRKFKDRQGLAYHYDNKRTFIRKGRTYTATFDGLHCVDDKQTQPYQSKMKDLVVTAHANVAKVGMFAFGKTSTPGSTPRLIVPIAGSAPLPPALLPPPTPVDTTSSSSGSGTVRNTSNSGAGGSASGLGPTGGGTHSSGSGGSNSGGSASDLGPTGGGTQSAPTAAAAADVGAGVDVVIGTNSHSHRLQEFIESGEMGKMARGRGTCWGFGLCCQVPSDLDFARGCWPRLCLKSIIVRPASF